MDIGRSVACITEGGPYNNPEIIEFNGTNITNCHDNLLNFFVDYPSWRILEDLPIPDLKFILEELYNMTLARPQDLLFELPMFYVGK